jgi:hypothetical protein
VLDVDCLVQIINELPGQGEITYQFPPDRAAEMGLLVRVQAEGDRHWIGVFGSSVPWPDAVTEMLSWPGSSHFLAISRGTGYFVNCEHAENYLEIPILPVMHKIDHPSGLTILGDFCFLAAVSAAGIVWKTESLSWDGIRELAVQSSEITGLGYDSPTDSWVEFQVDLRTGRHRGGASSPPG